MDIISRSEWGAAPPESVTRWNPASLDGICQHWFGSPRAANLHRNCAGQLRSVQRFHQAGEYNDIAYNFAVCKHGKVFECRGWDAKTGANGTSDANSRFLAVVYMAGPGDPLTTKAKNALGALYDEAFRRGVAETAHRHGEFVSTGCPGEKLSAWLASGVWRPKPPEPPKEEDPVQEVRVIVNGRIQHREAHTPGQKPDAYGLTVAWLDSAEGTGVAKQAFADGRDVVIRRVKV